MRPILTNLSEVVSFLVIYSFLCLLLSVIYIYFKKTHQCGHGGFINKFEMLIQTQNYLVKLGPDGELSLDFDHLLACQCPLKYQIEPHL